MEAPKYAALTFDDGPRADTTGRLLDGLLERGAAATLDRFQHGGDYLILVQQLPVLGVHGPVDHGRPDELGPLAADEAVRGAKPEAPLPHRLAERRRFPWRFWAGWTKKPGRTWWKRPNTRR